MATSAWSTEAWTDTQQSAGGVTDLTKIRWQADWSAEADGTILGDSNAYGMWNIYNGKISSEKLLNGRKAIKEVCDWPHPDAYFGTGFGRSFGDIPEGEQNTEMWFRVWVYHEAGFDWSTNAGRRKTMRQRERRSDGEYGGGSNDFNYVWPNAMGPNTDWGDQETAQIGCMAYNRESVNQGIDGGWDYLDKPANYKFNTGVWECAEMYVRSNSDYSGGEVRYWRDGVPVAVVPNRKTRLHATGSSVEEVLFVSYWNEGLTKDVTYWWCAPAVAVRNSKRDDTPHLDRDASGFPFIGVAT